jgi:hypothetical protein
MKVEAFCHFETWRRLIPARARSQAFSVAGTVMWLVMIPAVGQATALQPRQDHPPNVMHIAREKSLCYSCHPLFTHFLLAAFFSPPP